MSTRLHGQSPVTAAQLVALASPGGEYIADTGNHTGNFGSFLALTDCVGAFTSTDIRGTTTSVSVKAGAHFFGQFTVITLASGTGVAYDNPGR